MKRPLFLVFVLLTLLSECIALIVFAAMTPQGTQDTVAVNEVVQSVTRDFAQMETHERANALDYVVLDSDGRILYRTKAGLSESVNAAVAHRDTILEIKQGGATLGTVLIYNDGAAALDKQKKKVILVFSVAILAQCGICIGYAVYVYRSVVKPFRKLKGFAERVSEGNLDIPLEMDRRNLFGAFTESFDIMRAQLKKARLETAAANKSKKELVAKLSHDIKTPVASIKAVAEVGSAVTKTQKDRENYAQIGGKAEQIDTLVSNLFTATLEELEQLSVSPVSVESKRVQSMLENADYLHRAEIPALSECLVYADPLRLQQVFDNLFANAYKYAGTDVAVTTEKSGEHMRIAIEDHGGGVGEEELPVLKEKFRRGSNAENTEGAGLGLYISDYFMKEMGGNLQIENGEYGLKATVVLQLAGHGTPIRTV